MSLYDPIQSDKYPAKEAYWYRLGQAADVLGDTEGTAKCGVFVGRTPLC